MLCESIKYHLQNDANTMNSTTEGWPAGLVLTAKRYWLPELEVWNMDPEALTLVLLHSTSFHKETWEPSLARLLRASAGLVDVSTDVERGKIGGMSGKHTEKRVVKIREAWALDCPNHGEAGGINENALKSPEFRNDFGCEKYAKYVHRFLSDGHLYSPGVDFRRRNIIGIGHSLGANAMLIVQHLVPLIPFKCLIIVEPLISPAGPEHLERLRAALVKGAHNRRDVWANRAEALTVLKTRPRTKKWDLRIIELFVKHAVVPRSKHKEENSVASNDDGVMTLACTREQEAGMYLDSTGATLPVPSLKKACIEKPIHLVLGTIADFVPANVHTAIIDAAIYASLWRLEGLGHLIPQEAPDRLGDVMYNILHTGVISQEDTMSRL